MNAKEFSQRDDSSLDSDPNGLSQTDRSLVVMVREGDQDAATELYERYAKRVFGLVRKQLGSRLAAATEPDDIFQSVFKSAFRGMQSGHYAAPEGETLWNLLAVISVRKLKNKANHFSARCRDIKRNVPAEFEDLASTLDEPAIEFLGICVQETIEMLRPSDRAALSLRIKNHSVDEISTRSALAWLQEGEYILRFTAIEGTQLSNAPIEYSLSLDGLSDDQDDDGDCPSVRRGLAALRPSQ